MNKIFIGFLAIFVFSITYTGVSAQTEQKPVSTSTIEVLKPTVNSSINAGDTVFFAIKKTGKDAKSNVNATVSGPGYGDKDFVIGTNLNTGVFAWKVPVQIEEGTYVVTVRSTKSQAYTKVPLKVYQKRAILSRGTAYPSKTYIVDGIDVTNVPANSFVISANKDTVLDTVTVSYSMASSSIPDPTRPTTIYLYEKRGKVSKLLSSKVAAEVTTFYGLNSTIKSKDTVEYTVSFDVPENARTGYSIQVLVRDVKLLKGEFSRDSVSLPIAGSPMSLRNSTEPAVGKASYKIAARPTIQQMSLNQNGSTTEIAASFQLIATASGGTVTPKNTDFVVKFQKGAPAESNTNNPVIASAVNVTTIPMKPIASGESASVTVIATITPRELGSSGIYYAQLITPDGQKINTDWGVQVIAKNQSFTASVMDAIKQIFGF